MYHVVGLQDFEATLVKTTHNFIRSIVFLVLVWLNDTLLVWLTIDTRYFFPSTFSFQSTGPFEKKSKKFSDQLWIPFCELRCDTAHCDILTLTWECPYLELELVIGKSLDDDFFWRLLPWLWQATLLLFRDENKIYGSFIIQSGCYDTRIVAKLDVGPICKICLYHVYPFYTSLFTPQSLH